MPMGMWGILRKKMKLAKRDFCITTLRGVPYEKIIKFNRKLF